MVNIPTTKKWNDYFWHFVWFHIKASISFIGKQSTFAS